jgi:hypothetical protein
MRIGGPMSKISLDLGLYLTDNIWKRLYNIIYLISLVCLEGSQRVTRLRLLYCSRK